VSSPGWRRASAHHHDRVRVDHHCECRATAPPQRHVAGRPCLRNVDPRCNCIPRRPPACTGTTGSQHRRDHLAKGTAPPMPSQDQLNPRHQAAGRPRHTGPVRRYLGCLRRPKEARLAPHGPSPAIRKPAGPGPQHNLKPGRRQAANAALLPPNAAQGKRTPEPDVLCPLLCRTPYRQAAHTRRSVRSRSGRLVALRDDR